MAEWTHNLCEKCWYTSPEYSFHPSGGFRMPTRAMNSHGDDVNDICCACGVPTVSGIYIRADEKALLCKGDHEHPDLWSPIIRIWGVKA